LPNMQERHGRT